MGDRILTEHPQGKKGVNISRQKYEAMRDAIIASLAASGPVTHTDLVNDVEKRFAGGFDGSVRWYLETVKLDLEARGTLERVPGTKPQILRLIP